jgi:uncharacterized protein with PQ loop repeat
MLDLFGYIGAFCLAACAVPQLVKTVRTRSASDFDWYFLALWLIGDVSMLAYSSIISNWLLVANYGTNLTPICVIIYYKAIDTTNNP